MAEQKDNTEHKQDDQGVEDTTAGESAQIGEEMAAQAVDAPAPNEKTEGPDLADLQSQLLAAEENRLRAVAEAQNAIRRAEQEVERARKFALESFAKDLLPVVDNLERALAVAVPDGEAIQSVVEGVELTLKSLQDVLAKHRVEAIDPLGEPFDPEVHQAMSIIEKPDAEANSVIDVFQKGYRLNGRLIRPAMVVVSK